MTTGEMIDTNEIRERIRLMISEQGLRAIDFSDKTGLPRTTVSNILNGKTNPTLDVINKILAAFPDWSPNWLLFGNGAKKTEPQRLLFEEDITQDEVNTVKPDSLHLRAIPSLTDNAMMIQQGSIFSEFTDGRQPNPPQKNIEKILIFFTDRSYQTFFPEQNVKDQV